MLRNKYLRKINISIILNKDASDSCLYFHSFLYINTKAIYVVIMNFDLYLLIFSLKISMLILLKLKIAIQKTITKFTKY